MKTKRILFLILGLLLLALVGYISYRYYRITRPHFQPFEPQRAYHDVEYQVSLGPRTPGSQAQEKVIDYIRGELQKANWLVEVQTDTINGQTVKNVVARRSDVPPKVILGAHYDSRLLAERDPDMLKQQEPVPGANDGASGVAVLLELGRILPANGVPVWLVFFDAEDQGGIPHWVDWSLGARAFVNEFSLKPRAVVIVDMVGDPDLNIMQEKNSTPWLVDEIWAVAKDLGYGKYFLPEKKYAITDDHIPFIQAGIPAVDIIDIEYRYWHTSYDTADKVSPTSLGIVGATLQAWIGRQNR